MQSLFKIVLWIIGVAVGLFILTSLALQVLLPSEKLRHLVEEQIRVHLHRQAELGGAQLGLTHLTLHQFKLSEVMSFSQGTFLSVDKMTIPWELLPLLSRKVVVKTVVLNQPQIQIVRMKDGSDLNISDLAGATATSGKTAPAKPLPVPMSKTSWAWRVDEIDLLQGIIRFEDRSPAQQSSTLSNIDLVIRDFDPTRVQGHLKIGHIKNPVYTAQDLSMNWALHDMDPTLGHLNGTLHMHQGPGLVQNLTRLANSSPSAKLALLPLIAIQNVSRLGFIDLGLPDLSHLVIDQITGDYEFKNGLMTISTFQIAGPQLTLNATGSVQLAPGTLSIDVTLKTPPANGAMDVKLHISGTLSNPKTNLDSLKKKAFKATVKNLLDQPAVQKNINDALKNIFH